jgi:AraC-like DNA-binding protein
MNGVTDEASKNDIVFFPPNVHFKRTIYESLEFHNIGFCVPEPNSGWDKLCGKYSFEDKLRIESTVRMLSQLSSTDEIETSSEEQSHLTADILYQLAIEQKLKQNSSVNCDDNVINDICSFLRSNIASKINFEQLAKEYGMTQVQFIRRFSKAMGITPGKYLSQQRLKLAYSLLSSGAITVAETAKLCGFDSPFYLSECFKKQYGITPTEAKSAERAK